MIMEIVMKAPYDQNNDHPWLFSGHDHQISKTRDSSKEALINSTFVIPAKAGQKRVERPKGE